MAMTRQNIMALILLTAAVLLLVRQVVRMITGKTSGCSCAPPSNEPSDDNPPDTPER